MTETPLPSGYNPPNVFTQTTYNDVQSIIEGDQLTMVLIGTSDEVSTASSIEMIRGSSSTLDNPITGEDQSEAATDAGAPIYSFTTRYFPIVDGNGLGKVTNDPSKVKVYQNGDQVNVISLKGATGLVTLQAPVLVGDQLTIDYYFKKKDTYILDQDLSAQVPTSATTSFTVYTTGTTPTPAAVLSLSLTSTGPAGNASSIRFIASGSADSVAIQSNGTDALVVDIMSDSSTYRTVGQLAILLSSYAFTLSGGLVQASVSGLASTPTTTALVSSIPTYFSGGTGQASNTIFQVLNVPIVDGTNGGVVTTTTSDVVVTVNGSAVTVSAVDGEHGLITLANAVPSGASLAVTYYTNTYQYTADQLPNVDIVSVSQCGYSASGIDFIPGTSFVVNSDSNGAWYVDWGTSVSATATSTTSGATEFGSNVIIPQLVDHKMFMAQATGTCDGDHTVFTLPTYPTDGTGKANITDDPQYIKVYVGTDPYSASKTSPVAVASLTGSSAQVILNNPPASGNNVYATYWESLLADNTITLSSVAAGPGGVGSYSATSTAGTIIGYSMTATSVASPYFKEVGIVYPHDLTDFFGVPGGSPAEEITITFTSSMSYTVSSNRTAAQSNADGLGITSGVGYLNQTYKDPSTGVNFTILNPADAANLTGAGYTSPVTPTYAFAAGDTITFTGTSNTAFLTGSSNPQVFIPGVKMVVQNTIGITTGDQGTVTTYNKEGDEPSVGDVYYISYTYSKPSSAYDLMVYYATQEAKVYAAYGQPSASNPLALAAWLAFRNGVTTLGLMQVTRDSGLQTASDSKFITCFNKLGTLYPGMTRKPQIIVPLSTSSTLIPYLTKHVITQSNMRNQGECVGFFGFANNTNPSTVITTVDSIASNRMVAVYPDGGVIQLSDPYGNTIDIVVDGSYVAAAVAALYGDTDWDIATPRTRKPIVGFTRLYRNMDPTTANSVAGAGCTLIEQRGSTFRVRHAITTDPSTDLSIQPSITFLADSIQADIRDLLDPFIGQKFLNTVIKSMNNVLVSYFKAQVAAKLVQTYGTISVTRDSADSRIARVQASYVPVGELTYIIVDLSVSSMAD